MSDCFSKKDTNDVVTRSLEALVQVGAAEAGIPQVLLAAVELMASSFASDNELAQASRYVGQHTCVYTMYSRSVDNQTGVVFVLLIVAPSQILILRCDCSRLLEIAARVSTKLIRSHGVWQRQKYRTPVQTSYMDKPVGHVSELARLLVVIRSVQGRLQAKRNGPSRGAKVSVSLLPCRGFFRNTRGVWR